MAGIWGTWSLGFFASGQYAASGAYGPDTTPADRLTGVFYGGGFKLLESQIIGNVTITVATFAVAMALMYAVKATGTLRVSKEGELEGLDIHEHGLPAYPEYALIPSALPQGTPVHFAPAPAGDVKPSSADKTPAGTGV